MLGPVPEIEHAIRWQIRGIEIAQQRAAQLVVDVQQGARFDGLQPRQRLCVRESDAVLPGLIGGHPKVAGCCAVLDPRRQRWTQAGHGFAVPEGVEQAVDEARRLRPGRTLLTGMCHELVHDETNEWLARLKDQEGLDIQLAYDGLAVDVEI